MVEPSDFWNSGPRRSDRPILEFSFPSAVGIDTEVELRVLELELARKNAQILSRDDAAGHVRTHGFS